MGLAERRRIHDLKTTTLPERGRELEAIVGRAVPCDVDWATFESDDAALNFLDNAACHRLHMALRTIAVDALGREALQQGLGRIEIANVADPARRRASFEGGTLSLHAPWALGAEGLFTDGEIRALLMSRL